MKVSLWKKQASWGIWFSKVHEVCGRTAEGFDLNATPWSGPPTAHQCSSVPDLTHALVAKWPYSVVYLVILSSYLYFKDHELSLGPAKVQNAEQTSLKVLIMDPAKFLINLSFSLATIYCHFTFCTVLMWIFSFLAFLALLCLFINFDRKIRVCVCVSLILCLTPSKLSFRFTAL